MTHFTIAGLGNSERPDHLALHDAARPCAAIKTPGVRQTRTFFVMKEVVDNAPLDF
jgi:hypothetical protein